MKIKGITDEDFVNYKLPSMFIACQSCTFKCEKECGKHICQNSSLANDPVIEVSQSSIITRYLQNPITQAIVFGGLEPFDDIRSVTIFIMLLRTIFNDDSPVVIYTGYTEDEIKTKFKEYLKFLKKFSNIIIKFGRFIPDQKPHYDPILGVNLASDNQYAKDISEV